jgi:hypothetical protein
MRETEIPSSSEEYQAILTQRSVARAALHLGIDTLPSNTLIVLQDSLTQYLERVGRVLGNNVESSGRSTDHVNVLDAIRAIEDCALVNGHGLHGTYATNIATTVNGSGSGNGNTISNVNGNGISNGHGHSFATTGEWGDLARFLYGDSFDENISNDIGHDTNNSIPAAGGINQQNQGKGGTDNSQVKNQCWNAPLDDYDSIPSFPVQKGRNAAAGSSSASTHDSFKDPTIGTAGWITGPVAGTNSANTQAGDLARKADNVAGNAIRTDGIAKSVSANAPQRVGDTAAETATTTVTGTGTGAVISQQPNDQDTSSNKTKSSAKRKREDDANTTSDAPSNSKRSKSQKDDSKEANSKETVNGGSNNNGNIKEKPNDFDEHTNDLNSLENDKMLAQPLPSYIPKFLPSFPPKHTYTKSSRPVPPPVEMFQSQDIRSSLVQLGQSYWGAMPLADTREQKADASKGVFVKVKTGSVDMSVMGVGTGIAAAGKASEMEGVKPVARASNARVSRILEGSMDVHS